MARTGETPRLRIGRGGDCKAFGFSYWRSRSTAFRIGRVVVRMLNTFEGIWRYFGIERILIGILMREGRGVGHKAFRFALSEFPVLKR